jgi:hypothetical protein
VAGIIIDSQTGLIFSTYSVPQSVFFADTQTSEYLQNPNIDEKVQVSFLVEVAILWSQYQ